MQRIIKIIVPLLLIIAFLAAVAWAICAPDFEPAITSLALLASLIAIFADRWINSRERRKELLRVLAHELYMNIGVVNDLNEALETIKKALPGYTFISVQNQGNFILQSILT